MCFLYELHEYIELLKEQYNFDEKIIDDIDDIENNIVDIYYNNKIYDIYAQIDNILSHLNIETNENINTYDNKESSNSSKNGNSKSIKIINEIKENIIDIYGINKKKKKEYYSYICDIKNITIE
jgi:hypothetical protein